MNINWRAFSRIVGFSIFAVGLSMLPSLIIAGIYHETPAFLAFMYTLAGTCFIGSLLIFAGRDYEENIRIRDGALIVSAIWLLASLAGAVPFMVSGAIPGFFDAFFESCSGFSTTGSSILNDVELLPKSILFWRSLSQWLGAAGILIFAIALMPALGISGQNVTVKDAPKRTLDSLSPKITDTLKFILTLYIIFTILELILLTCSKMTFFDALIHTFSSVGTGGFSSYNDGIAHFGSFYIEAVILVFMFLAGTNFNLFYMSFKQEYNYFKENSEFKFYFVMIMSATVLLMVNLYTSGTYSNSIEAMRHSVFQTTSIITTTGFASADFALWPTFSKMVLLLLMLTGGCAASAGGGLKLIRILVLLKLIRRGIATQLHPNAVVNIHVNESTIPPETVTNITNHTFLYVSVAMISTLVLSLDGFDLITNFTSVITCLGNIGPAFNLAGPMASFSMFSGPAKLLLSFLMLAGRLELFTLLMILTPKFWRHHF